ncbi:MAG: bifunctional acetate--CoA ligase family protein/GNAT family N-acetyltransferase [Candidatus Bathyarchaeota archaeon]|nr:bifunctional acetate--CoA ligase family protein/GNAT family N-acetyltransferase [Candidatus Bathyarchaeota archaeon]
MATLNLDKIFNPQSVAIIGASDTEGSVGYAIVKNFTRLGYGGKVYFVNIRKPEILGVKTYPSVQALPEAVDLAMIATPAKTVPDVIEECGKAGVKGAIIVSAGFKETGPEGKALEQRILEIASQYGIRIVGPNCIGVIRPRVNLNATFVDKVPKSGNVAFISQSGALGSAILDWAIHENIGFSNFVSVGSMIDVDFGDLIDYFGTDPKTKSILMYVEGITEARKFMSAARHFARTKPIIVVKSGRFSESAKAAASHTGSLSGEDSIYDAAFKRAGVVRVEEIADLFNAAEVLGTQPLPKGPRLAIITNAGGPGVMTTDALIAKGGKLAKLSQKTLDTLDAVLPPFWSHGNPIDVLGDAGSDRYKAALDACLKDENIDGILIIFTQQAVSSSVQIAKEITDLVRDQTYHNKTILTSFMGYGAVQDANSLFNANNIPTYSTPEQAVKAYMYMHQYQRNVELIYETPEELSLDASPPKRPIMVILRNAASEDREVLTEDEAKRILKYYNFPVVKTAVANNVDEAIMYSRQMGYPVVLKILSPQIVHKSDAGGVILNVHSDAEVREAFDTLIQRATAYNPEAQIIGVTVQPMVQKKGYEVIIGGKTDPIFGPVILFGMGGVGVELFKDYSIGLPPLNTTLIRRMMEETKVYKLLKGYRNSPPANTKKLEETILLFSQLLVDFPQIKEIDINPLLVNEKDASILDARIVIDKKSVCKKFEPHEHIVISPYPKKHEILWTLKNGQDVLLRPIKPEDEPMWLDMFQSFSEESIRYRFFQLLRDTPHEVRVRYCNIDYDREIAIVAEMLEGGRRNLLGVSRLSIEPDGKSGEMAFVVGDKWQNYGLGTKMVDYVLDIAKEKGVENVYAIMLPDNYRALSLTQKMGFDIEYLGDGTVKGVLDLKKEDASDMQCLKPKTQQQTPDAKTPQTPEQTKTPTTPAPPTKDASNSKTPSTPKKETELASA